MSGEAWDRRADVYALGAIARDVAARYGAVDVPEAWDRAIARATAENPADRFESATAFVAALTLASVPALAVSTPSVTAPAPMTIDTGRDLDTLREVSTTLPAPVFDAPAGPTASPTPDERTWPEKAEPTPSPAPAPAAATRKETPAATRGSLMVDSRPRRASVILDGRTAGATPLVIPDLSPGTHSVLIQLKGHRPVPSSVVIVAGEQTRLALSLERLGLTPESSRRKPR